jgi:GTP-binding protein
MIVDLPGYGYAKVSKTESLRWLERLEEYLTNRPQLRRLFILIDSRIGPKESDLELMDFCDENGICYQVVYTKKDKKVREQNQLKLSHENHAAMMEEIFETSAEKKYGLEKLKDIIYAK